MIITNRILSISELNGKNPYYQLHKTFRLIKVDMKNLKINQ